MPPNPLSITGKNRKKTSNFPATIIRSISRSECRAQLPSFFQGGACGGLVRERGGLTRANQQNTHNPMITNTLHLSTTGKNRKKTSNFSSYHHTLDFALRAALSSPPSS